MLERIHASLLAQASSAEEECENRECPDPPIDMRHVEASPVEEGGYGLDAYSSYVCA